jgi:hypothetical protein
MAARWELRGTVVRSARSCWTGSTRRVRELLVVPLGVAVWVACGGKIEQGPPGGSPGAGDDGGDQGHASSGSGGSLSSGGPLHEAGTSPSPVSSPGPAGSSSGAGPKGCSVGGSGSSSSGGGCVTDESWACPNGNDYSVECSCPPGTCICSRNGGATGKIFPYEGCPNCSTQISAQAWVQCGFTQ